MTERKCENCAWFSPENAEGWEKSDYLPMSSLARWLHKQRKRISGAGWPGKCIHGPARADVRSTNLCSHWDVNEWFLSDVASHNRQTELRDYEDSLWKQLKEERNRSRARFRKLKELRAKL